MSRKGKNDILILFPTKNCQPFEFFCQEWLQNQKSGIRESSYAKYVSTLYRHILPKLGKCPPSGIDTRTVETFKTKLLEEGLSAQSVRNILIVLHSILRYMAEEYPGICPSPAIRYPRETGKEARVLSREEHSRLLDYLLKDMDPCKFGVLLALQTGLRIGEICALRWENISLRDKTLRISSSMQRLKDRDGKADKKTKILIGDPKSASSTRTIPLPEVLVAFCRQEDPHCPAAYVLTGTEKYMEPRTLQRRFERYAKDCSMEGVHFHTLRHTFATRCMEAGFELKSLSEILGHARTSTTLDLYVHSSLEEKRNNMEKLGQILCVSQQT